MNFPNRSRIGMYQPSNYEEIRLRELLANLGDWGGLAGDVMSGMDNVTREAAGAGPDGWMAPALEEGIGGMMSGGMSGAEVEAGDRKVANTFNSVLGNIAGAGAKRGYYSPKSYATAAVSKAPGLGRALGDLQAKRDAAGRQSRSEGVSALAGLYPNVQARQSAREGAVGGLIGNLLAGQPIRANYRSPAQRRF